MLTLDAALDGHAELVTSPLLLREITSVLARQRLRKYVSADEATRFVADLAAQTTCWSISLVPARPCVAIPETTISLRLPRRVVPKRSSPAISTCRQPSRRRPVRAHVCCGCRVELSQGWGECQRR